MSKIILCGANSVGKSVLADDWCSKNRQYIKVGYVARDVMKKLKITEHQLRSSLSSREKTLYFKYQRMVVEEQNRREAELGNRPLHIRWWTRTTCSRLPCGGRTGC